MLLKKYHRPKERSVGVYSMKSLVIVDYGSGNLHSVQQSVIRVANELKEEWAIKTSSDPKEVLKSDYIILPTKGTLGGSL